MMPRSNRSLIQAGVAAALLFCASLAQAELVWEHKDVQLQAAPTDREAVGHYPFKNQGTEVVKFKNLQSNCDCVSMTVSTMVVPPGASGEVTVNFRLGYRIGAQKRPIIVELDDASKTRTMLSLQVAIPEVVRALPLVVKWDHEEKREPKTVTIHTDEKYPVQNIRVAPTDWPVKTRVIPIEGSPNYTLELAPDPGVPVRNYTVDVEATLAGGQVKRTPVLIFIR